LLHFHVIVELPPATGAKFRDEVRDQKRRGWSPERQRNKGGDLGISGCDDSGGLSIHVVKLLLLCQTKGLWWVRPCHQDSGKGGDGRRLFRIAKATDENVATSFWAWSGPVLLAMGTTGTWHPTLTPQSGRPPLINAFMGLRSRTAQVRVPPCSQLSEKKRYSTQHTDSGPRVSTSEVLAPAVRRYGAYRQMQIHRPVPGSLFLSAGYDGRPEGSLWEGNQTVAVLVHCALYKRSDSSQSHDTASTTAAFTGRCHMILKTEYTLRIE
jgi:hypothetical protein